jgi:hypothetical protein
MLGFGYESVALCLNLIAPISWWKKGHAMMFTIEFFRMRKENDAHATLDRITHMSPDLESAKVKARSLFDTLNMPQNPDGLRLSGQDGNEVFFWTPGTGDS